MLKDPEQGVNRNNMEGRMGRKCQNLRALGTNRWKFE